MARPFRQELFFAASLNIRQFRNKNCFGLKNSLKLLEVSFFFVCVSFFWGGRGAVQYCIRTFIEYFFNLSLLPLSLICPFSLMRSLGRIESFVKYCTKRPFNYSLQKSSTCVHSISAGNSETAWISINYFHLEYI